MPIPPRRTRPQSRPPSPSGVLFTACALLALLLAGCSSFGLAAPEVTLVDLEFTDLTLFETSGLFTVRLSNANPEPMAVEGGVYNLYLGGWKVGRGLSDSRLEVPALGTTTDEVQLHMSNLAIATQVREIWESKVLDYRIKAKIYVNHGYGRRTLKIDTEGRVDLEKVQRDRAEPVENRE